MQRTRAPGGSIRACSRTRGPSRAANGAARARFPERRCADDQHMQNVSDAGSPYWHWRRHSRRGVVPPQARRMGAGSRYLLAEPKRSRSRRPWRCRDGVWNAHTARFKLGSRGLAARERMYQMIEPHLACAMGRSNVVGLICTCEQRVIDPQRRLVRLGARGRTSNPPMVSVEVALNVRAVRRSRSAPR